MVSWTDAISWWHAATVLRKAVAMLLCAAALGQGIVGVLLKDNDFLWHRHLGEAFLQRDPYRAGGAHYLPARAMLDAAMAWLPYRIDRAVAYMAALAALAWALRAWRRLADDRDRIPQLKTTNQTAGADGRALEPTSAKPPAGAPPCPFPTLMTTLVVAGAYLQRDLDDCGLQILLLFFLSAAAVAQKTHRPWRCGFWLALAAAYKLTPVLFLPYLCWKRHGRAAMAMVVFLGILCLAPAFWLGWDKNQEAHRRWWAQTQKSLSADDPTENGVEPPNPRNQALTLAVARLVQTYPPGHPLYVDHPLFAQLLQLSSGEAKRVVQAVLVLLAGFLAWQFYGERVAGADDQMPREWSIVILFIAILSPLCWLQHLVLVVPAVFLVVRAAFEPGGLSRRQWWIAGLAGFIMIFAGQRDLLGHGLFMVAMASKLHTWAALGVVALVLTLRRSPVGTLSQLQAQHPAESSVVSLPITPAA